MLYMYNNRGLSILKPLAWLAEQFPKARYTKEVKKQEEGRLTCIMCMIIWSKVCEVKTVIGYGRHMTIR